MHGPKTRSATPERLAPRARSPRIDPTLSAAAIAAAMDADRARITQYLADLLRRRTQRADADLSARQLRALTDLLLLLHTVALTDELTGVCNRRGFLHTGTQVLEFAARVPHRALLTYVDVDQLKSINDALGHEAGDQLLRRTAEVLRAVSGNHAVIGRLGGDEFALLTLSTDCGDREQMPHRMQKAVEASNCSAAAPSLSLSSGSVEFDPRNPLPIVVLLEQADRAMYGKKNGKMRRLDREVN